MILKHSTYAGKIIHFIIILSIRQGSLRDINDVIKVVTPFSKVAINIRHKQMHLSSVFKTNPSL